MLNYVFNTLDNNEGMTTGASQPTSLSNLWNWIMF